MLLVGVSKTNNVNVKPCFVLMEKAHGLNQKCPDTQFLKNAKARNPASKLAILHPEVSMSQPIAWSRSVLLSSTAPCSKMRQSFNTEEPWLMIKGHKDTKKNSQNALSPSEKIIFFLVVKPLKR